MPKASGVWLFFLCGMRSTGSEVALLIGAMCRTSVETQGCRGAVLRMAELWLGIGCCSVRLHVYMADLLLHSSLVEGPIVILRQADDAA